MPELRLEIGEMWRAINRSIHERLREAFRGCELSFSALILLRKIKNQPGVTIGELARSSHLVKSQVSKTVEQLVSLGYVEKRADPGDQRLVRIYVSESGAQGFSELEARGQAAWSEVMDAIPGEELADVARGLRILLSALERTHGQVPPS